MTPEGRTRKSSLGGILLVALALLGFVTLVAPVIRVTHAQYGAAAACQYSPNGNAYAYASEWGTSGAYYAAHDSFIRQYINSNGFAKAIDNYVGGTVWFNYFTPTKLEYSEVNAYGIQMTVSTYTQDGTTSGYGGPGFVWVQILNGVAYPQCPYQTPVRP